MNHPLDDRSAVDSSARPATSPALTPLVGLAALASAALQACGGGSSGGSVGGGDPPPAESTDLTRAQAARVLGSAAFGGDAAEIENLRTLKLEGWLAAQFALPRSQGHVAWMRANGYEVMPNDANVDRNGVIRSVWRKLISSPDPLRQRITLAQRPRIRGTGQAAHVEQHQRRHRPAPPRGQAPARDAAGLTGAQADGGRAGAAALGHRPGLSR